MISLSDLTIPQLYTPSAGFEPASSSSLERRIIQLCYEGVRAKALPSLCNRRKQQLNLTEFFITWLGIDP